MGTVTIANQPYNTYGDLASAKLYLQAAIGAGPKAWNALAAVGTLTADDVKGQYLVQAFRMLDVLAWSGSKTSSSQPMAWPRTGVTDIDGNPVAVDAVPKAIENAMYELAAQLAGDPTIATAVQSGSNVHRVEAKGVGVQFFRPTNIPGVSPTFPVPVQRLIGPFLGSAKATPLSQSFQSNDADDDGVDDGSSDIDSAFANEAIMDRVGPLI